jgi:hypothetical protein
MSGTVWVDCALDMVEALARIQRGSVEQIFTAHSKVVGQFAESARTIAAASPDLTPPHRPNPKGQDRPRDSSS